METSKNFAGEIEKAYGQFGCRQYRGERSFPLENHYLTLTMYVECLRPRGVCC